MRFAFEDNSELEQLKGELQRSVEKLLHGKTPVRARGIVPIGTDISSLATKDGVYVLREGILAVSCHDRELCWLEEGDLILVPEHKDLQLRIDGEFATVCDYYQFAQWDERGSAQAIFTCMGLYSTLSWHLVSLLHKGERRANPSIRSIKKGDPIVVEGEVSDRVFTLLEGHAEVSTAGQIVGEVKTDELIGVIGALCSIPRIATVTATKDSLIMSLGKDEFVDLLSLRPHTVIKLIEDFARIITASNQQLIELKSQKRFGEGMV